MRSLRTQLVVSHLFLVFIMGLVVAVAIWQFFRISASVEQILQENFTTVLAAQDMDAAIAGQQVAFSMLLSGDLTESRRVHDEAVARYEEALKKASESSTTEQELGLIQMIREDASRVRTWSGAMLDGSRLSLQPGSVEIVRSLIYPTLATMRVRCRALRTVNEDAVISDYQLAQGRAERAAWRTVLTSLGAVVLAVLLGLRMVQFALHPLSVLSKRAERIAAGEFLPAEPTTSVDEVGALAQSFNTMEQKLAEMRVTETRRLQRAEQMSDAALESLYDPVVVTDANRRIVFLNRAAEGLFGPVPPGSRIPVNEHIPDRRIVKAIQSAVGEQRVSASEDEAAIVPIRTGEADRTYRLRATPMRGEEEQLLGSVTVLEDITHLRVLDQLKTEFIGVASHELRTPVTSLILANQLLLEGAIGDLSASQREVVEAQQQDLNRLEKLMRDLLDVTRLEAGSSPPRMELVSPWDLVEGPMMTLRPQALRKGLEFKVEVPKDLPKIRADRTQVGRVLTNLVANAIRHTNTGGSVVIRASASEKDVSFRVEDTGEGIPSDYLERIFERFVQVPGATQGGAGLGLSITQNIVRAHGGQMSVESELGKGSMFGFSLPLEAERTEGQTA